MDRFDELLDEMRCVDNFFTLECQRNRSWQQFMFQCVEPDLREKLWANHLMDPAQQPMAIAYAQKWYDDRGKGPWATSFDAKKRPLKTKGSVHTVELEDDPVEDLVGSVSKSTKCTSCGKTGHDARSCLTSSKLVNIQPFKAEGAKREAKQDEKKCTFCDKKGHIQRDCWTFAQAIREAQASRQGNAGSTPAPTSNRGGNREGRGGRRNTQGRGRGRGGRGRGGPRSVNQVTTDPGAGNQVPNPPGGGGPVPGPGSGAEN